MYTSHMNPTERAEMESLSIVPSAPKCHGCKGDADFESDSGAPFCGECLFGE